MIQVTYSQEWDMTASLATNWIAKIKESAVQLDLARKVYETSVTTIRSHESTFWNESFTDAEKVKLALIEVERSILDDLKSENTRIATDWAAYQEAVRKVDTWLNRYLPGYDYTLTIQQSNAARALMNGCIGTWNTQTNAIMALHRKQMGERKAHSPINVLWYFKHSMPSPGNSFHNTSRL